MSSTDFRFKSYRGNFSDILACCPLISLHIRAPFRLNRKDLVCAGINSNYTSIERISMAYEEKGRQGFFVRSFDDNLHRALTGKVNAAGRYALGKTMSGVLPREQ